MSGKNSDKYYFDPEAGERVIKFIERYCRNVEGKLYGQLITLLPWQKEIIRDVFGWKHKSTGYRRYKFIYIEVPKKNGKSTLIAAITLYMLGWDGEMGGRIYGAAADRDNARIIFDTAKKMVELSPELSHELETYQYTIIHPNSNSVYKVVSADAGNKHGPNLSGILIDEVAVQPTDELYNTLTKGIVSRTQPMVWMLTTAQIVETFGHTLHKQAKDIQDGIIENERWYVKIFSPPKNLTFTSPEWRDPKWWKILNPSFGVSVEQQYFEEEVQEILNDPSKLPAFLRFHMNVWVTTTQSWHVADIWDDCPAEAIDLDALKGRPCYGGLDLAYTDDMNAFVMVFPPYQDDPITHVVPFFWIPEKTVIDRAKREHTQFLQWTKDDVVYTQPSDAVELDELAEDILEIIEGHNFYALGYDKYRANEAVKILEKNGVTCYAFRQGPVTFNIVIERLQKLVMNKELNHGNNPVLRWQIGNVQLYEDREQNKWVHKQKSTGKIDGIVAMLNGFAAWMHEEAGVDKKPEVPKDWSPTFM